MSPDFWAGYISGAVGICVGNPLDIIKVQSQLGTPTSNVSYHSLNLRKPTVLLKGAATPILAYGALNSLLFTTYNRSLKILDPSIINPTDLHRVSLYNLWFAGAIGGLSTWVVSAPSELIKCRTQLHEGTQTSSLRIFKKIWKQRGLRGLYLGGLVTSIRDSVGYGFYFSSYELCRRLFASHHFTSDYLAADFDVLVSGGIAGIVTWASIYPLDVVKTRFQAEGRRDREAQKVPPVKGSSAAVARSILNGEGVRAFYSGLTVCSVRAFFVNAIQWYTYEKIMGLLSPHPHQQNPLVSAKSEVHVDP